MSQNSNPYLTVRSPNQQWIADRLTHVLKGEAIVPAFPDVAAKLFMTAQREESTIDEFLEIISLDPGLVTRCIQVASSVAFAARPINSIRQAIMIIGIQQTRKIALAVAAIGCFAGFKGSVDWRRYWFHNVLVARLTDKVAATFRRVTGMEYLAGLLHDVGKLVVERYFPSEFAEITGGAITRKCSHAKMEKEILGLDHTQIGAAICDCMNVHPHILRAIWFHHDSLNLQHTSDPRGDGGFLATCISIADRLANNRAAYAKNVYKAAQEIEDSVEWTYLQRLFLPHRILINLEEDVKRAQEDLLAFIS